MKILLQRVSSAQVSVEGEVVGHIAQGLLLFVGIARGDNVALIQKAAKKVAHLRIFTNDVGKFDYSLLDIQSHTLDGALVVSQFTLFAETSKGRRPDFFGAMPPEDAAPLVESFGEELYRLGIARVQYGRFGQHMEIESVNDGPVTLMMEF